MSRPIAVLTGFIGKYPIAGMMLYNLHYVAGLQALGYDVVYVERIMYPNECYDPSSDSMTSEVALAVHAVRTELAHHGIGDDRFALVDLDGTCHGMSRPQLRKLLERADFVLTVADNAWDDDFAACPRRLFVDGDPMFTQASLVSSQRVRDALEGYDTLCTIGNRMGMSDCAVPDLGRQWIPTRSVVSTSMWQVTPPNSNFPVTGVMNWAAGAEVIIEGVAYGHKNREFEKIRSLPRRTDERLVLALGGNAPREALLSEGWEIADPLLATASLETYQRFIRESKCDLGIAKHAYVASRSGWFSDRSLCYLASGRPVIHQDTGFRDWLPVEDGVLAFGNMDELLGALELIDRDLENQSRAARAVAERYFEGSVVLHELLSSAGLR